MQSPCLKLGLHPRGALFQIPLASHDASHVLTWLQSNLKPLLFTSAEPQLSTQYHPDYGTTVPCSTDFRGRFLSHVVSQPVTGSAGSGRVDERSASSAQAGHRRAVRSALRPSHGGRYSLYFNVTVFGEQLHLHLRPNRRLVVPGASVEWQENFQKLFRQPLQQECVYTGGITGMPGAAVAISNCDGLVRNRLIILCLPPASPCQLG